MNYKEESLPLIVFDQNTQKYGVHEPTMKLISQIPPPLGIVGVAGMYRTGKSYLLNRMILNRSNGFGVGNTVNACTKGLWVWGTPLKGTTTSGEPCNILVVDSEGIGALDEDSNHDNKIFSLTILLSSCFIYNSVGSIDENAIQNLSLVVNLTKHIQVSSSEGEEETDYSQYFPSFNWVIRDFTLQLVDEEGDPISSKDYLERSLAPQKGFTDDVETKNRIRRLLQTFFVDRDCITMVRPLLNEESLQNLDKMDLKNLRPEFYEQVINLRSKILNKIKPKQINGKNLNGQMYCSLAQTYITAINTGGVPNIESAWVYLCRDECVKALDNAMEVYEKALKEQINPKIPTTLDELKTLHKLVKQTTIDAFKSKAAGDVIDEYTRELLNKIKKKFSEIKARNEKESFKVCQEFVQKEFAPIEKKLKLNEYQKFFDFERDIKLFYQYLQDHGPKTENSKVVFLEFLNRVMSDGSLVFIRTLQGELEIEKSVSQEFKQKNETELKDAKDALAKEKNSLSSKLNELEDQRTKLQQQEKKLRDDYRELESSKVKVETELRDKLSNEMKEKQRVIDDLRQKMNQAEDKSKDAERKLMIKDSDVERDKALISQKTEQYERQIKELREKERESDSLIRNLKQEQQSFNKDVQSKMENNARDLQRKITELNDKNGDLQREIDNIQHKFELDKKRFEGRDQTLSAALEDANATIKRVMQQVSEQSVLDKKKFDAAKKDYEDQISFYQEKVKTLEATVKDYNDNFKNSKSNLEKDKAVLVQKIEFLEMELTDIKQQLSDTKKAHDATLRALEMGSELGQRSESKDIIELKEKHLNDIRRLEAELDAVKKRLGAEIDDLNKRNSELEIQLKMKQNEFDKEFSELRGKYNDSELAREKLENDLKSFEINKAKWGKDIEDRYNIRIKSLENEIDDLKRRLEQDVRDHQIRSEETISQLKKFFDEEKSRLEKRIQEEKEKADKRYHQTVDEYEQKLKSEMANLEEEIDNLKEELRDHEQQAQAMIQNYEHELEMRQKTIENLEKLLKEAKENLAGAQKQMQNHLENQNNTFNNERNNYIEKIETLKTDVGNKDKELAGLQQKKENLEQNLNKKEQQVEKLKKDLADEKANGSDKLEELRKKNQVLSDEYMNNKIQNEKALALANQQNDFLTKKLEELQKQLELANQKFEEKLKQMRDDLIAEFNDKLDRMNEDKGNLEQKYERVKKGANDEQSKNTRTIQELERDRAIMQEKIKNLEDQLSDLKTKYQTESHSYNLQITNMRESSDSEKKPLLAEVEKYKTLAAQLEADKAELMAMYEKDRTLWESKFNFLEKQKEQAKADLSDTMKKFEATLIHLQRARSSEKTEHESNLSEMLISIERKYQSQIADMTDAHSRMIVDLEDKIRKQEKENRTLNEKNYLDSQGKLGSQVLNEKRLSEYMEKEKKLLSELEVLKLDREARVNEYQKTLDHEREAWKSKILDMEMRLKDGENKRSQMIFELEKERAKWNIEKDHLNTKLIEHQDSVLNLEKKKEILLRENEKLRNDIKSSKKSYGLNQSVLNTSRNFGDSLKRSPSGKILSNEIINSPDKNKNESYIYTSERRVEEFSSNNKK